jgi:hypothetical protein
MPVTRKAIDILAPRTSLARPENADPGNELLEAVRRLIERGFDPESALEASLRSWINQGSGVPGDSPIAGIETERGRDFA